VAAVPRARTTAPAPSLPAPLQTLKEAVEEASARAIVAALRATRGHHGDAAKILAVPYRTLTRRIADLGLADALAAEGRAEGWPAATARATAARLGKDPASP
jgi:DNA-binding NtrC family response regulator